MIPKDIQPDQQFMWQLTANILREFRKGDSTMQKVYKYRSPMRPMPMNYLPKDIIFNYDNSDIGAWNPKTVYAFDRPIPDNLIKQWDLQVLS